MGCLVAWKGKATVTQSSHLFTSELPRSLTPRTRPSAGRRMGGLLHPRLPGEARSEALQHAQGRATEGEHEDGVAGTAEEVVPERGDEIEPAVVRQRLAEGERGRPVESDVALQTGC